MPIGVSITVNTAQAIGYLKAATSRHVPFAVATALTRVAKSAGDALASEAKGSMTISNAWAARHRTASLSGGIPKSAGLVSVPARKSSSLSGISARVGHVGWQMAQQMDSEPTTRKPLTAAYRFIPLAVGRTKRGGVRKADRPASLIGKPGVFIRKTSKGAILFRAGKGRSITPLYKLVKAQRIKPRMDFQSTVRSVARSSMDRELARAMAQAFASSRGRR